MKIRNTRPSDLDAVMEIYGIAREFMRANKNANQWGSMHPKRELIVSDIADNDSYVVEENGEIIGTFFFKVGDDPTYETIYDGKWIDSGKYGVIHRIAMKYQGRGIASFVYDYCFNMISNLRIDTHADNIPMQRSLVKCGFVRCGTIYLESGAPRVAYQKVT